MPTPPKSTKKADPESDTESNAHSGQKDSGLRIPTGVGNDRRTVYEPGIVLRHVHHFRTGRFNDDGVALSAYILLFIAIQVAILVSLLT
jgi:hypothetical protein